MKYFSTLPALIFSTFLLINANLNAQEKLNEKIKKIEGSVEKITVTADGKEYMFEGEEAAALFNKMKSSSGKSLFWVSNDDDKSNKKKVVILSADDEDELFEIESENDNLVIVKTDKDFDSILDGIQKKVKVEIEVEEGNKKVTVTTKENDEEKTEVYEGREADEYIENLRNENKDIDISVESKTDSKKVKMIIIVTEKEEKSK